MKYVKVIAVALIGLLMTPLSLAGAQEPAPSDKPEYKVYRHAHETDSLAVYYPQVDHPNMLTSILANYQLIQAPGRIMADAMQSDKINIDYTVTRYDANLISVVYKGELIRENNAQPILTSVNYNLKNKLPLTAKNLVQDSEQAKRGISRLLQQAGQTNVSLTEPPEFDENMGIYITGQQVVFYYQPSEATEKPIEMPVAIELVRPYLRTSYQDLAITAEVQADQSQVITDVAKSLADYESVSGKSESGETTTAFTAYFDKDQLVYIEEDQTSGNYSESKAQYYFDKGQLIAYIKSGLNLIVPLNGIADVQREEISMYFDAALNLTEGERKLDKVTYKLTADDIKEIHAAASAAYNRAVDQRRSDSDSKQ